MTLRIFTLLACLVSPFSMAAQFQNIKDLEVHYSAFNAQFLTADVARSYDIKRSGYNGVISISVLDRYQAGKPAIEAKVTGSAKNLLGSQRKLDFKPIKEGNAIYYIAQFPITNEELLRFTINIDGQLKGKGPINFQQTFYTQE
ncbi:DUF4426 domain-containing protein [Vibrio ulleungensis]|uniref:DUF4426 domain-containing protein n=1 Tax=Vibrio ulleungensis TaxID=2807619 RepID=A0ABS2HPZ0_9VIBR|nr:DUF4426 domain-containing protein [Vibrio ulleungensis]MBM7037947.1 DUF4426 domain-containing protein [Vibrio ulleungensis]